LWSWNNEGDYPKVFELIIDRFERAHPEAEVDIQWVPYTEYNEKLKATIAAGDYPEIPEIHPGSPMYSLYQAGELLSLNEALKTGFPKYFPSALADLTFDGGTYSIPLDVNNLTVFYNKNAFRKVGRPIPQTIDDLISLCKALRSAGYMGIAHGAKDGWPAGDLYFQMVAYTDGSHTLLRKADFGKLTWNRPEFIEAALQIIKMNENGVFPPRHSSRGLLYRRRSAVHPAENGHVLSGRILDRRRLRHRLPAGGRVRPVPLPQDLQRAGPLFHGRGRNQLGHPQEGQAPGPGARVLPDRR